MYLINSIGQIVEEWTNIPTKFFINTNIYKNGTYYLKIQTNVTTETVSVIINHN
jgi:hypothetical protein